MYTGQDDISFREAKSLVLRFLSTRGRSELEVREKLRLNSVKKPLIDQTVRFFEKLNLINDRQLAREWIRSRLSKPLGLNRIRDELSAKGIDEGILQEELRSATKDYHEAEVIDRLVRQQAKKLTILKANNIKQRIYRSLIRRGFDPELTAHAVERL